MRPGSPFDVAHNSKSIEQFEAHNQGQLLTRDRVHQCLEDGQEPRWLHPSEPNSEAIEPLVAFGDSIPGA
jgi:hypothetical protein